MGKTHKSISFMLCMVMILSLIFIPNDSVNAATKVKINKKSATIYVGKTVQLKVTGTQKKVTWKSSNKKVATVTTKGKVKGVKKGKATITATVSKKKYSCKVTVKEKVIATATPTVKPTEKPNAIATEIPKATNTPKPTVIPTEIPMSTPTPPPGSIIIPTQTPVVTFGAIEYCNIGEDYTSKNGLTVCVNSIEVTEMGNGCTCTINYSIENNTENIIEEPSFRIFDEDSKTCDQYGSFGYIYPGGYERNVNYTFTVIGKAKLVVLELQTDPIDNFQNYNSIINPNELHWKIKY